MLYYLDSFSNVNTFSSASIHTIKQSFPVPSRVFFILLIKRTLQIFITTAEKRALVTCLPPYKTLQTSRSYIYVSFNRSLPNLASLLIPAKTFFPAVLKDFRWLLVISKVEKPVGEFIYPVVLIAGAWNCVDTYWKVSWVKDAHLYRIELELVRTFFIALWEGLTF